MLTNNVLIVKDGVPYKLIESAVIHLDPNVNLVMIMFHNRIVDENFKHKGCETITSPVKKITVENEMVTFHI